VVLSLHKHAAYISSDSLRRLGSGNPEPSGVPIKLQQPFRILMLLEARGNVLWSLTAASIRR